MWGTGVVTLPPSVSISRKYIFTACNFTTQLYCKLHQIYIHVCTSSVLEVYVCISGAASNLFMYMVTITVVMVAPKGEQEDKHYHRLPNCVIVKD